MIGEGSFRVEDFIQAITAQLDRVQDALRLKAVNRPLTYALKDLAMDLKVFVELDSEGAVRFRSAGANEEGASVVWLAFITITKPMIEENTITLEATQSPSLEEIGLAPDERKRLEQVGVRNAAQLRNLNNSTGTGTVARVSLVPIDRLRQALVRSTPRVNRVRALPRKKQRRQSPLRPGGARGEKPRVGRDPGISLRPAIRHFELQGRNLIADSGRPAVRLDGHELRVVSGDDERLVVEAPSELTSGLLEVEMPDGETQAFELQMDDTDPEFTANGHADAWTPQGEDGTL